MCGRYRLTAKERWLSSYFNLPPEDVAWAARWNVAPTQQVATIRQERNRRQFALMRWGLIPYWARDASIAAHTINAMSETAAEKPAFKDAIRHRRCLIPSDGFYEWQKTGRAMRQPWSFGLADGSVFAFAGLWDRWRDPATGTDIETCTILTTRPNSLVADVHNRMPVILRRPDYDLWLDPAVTSPERVSSVLHPYDAREMRRYPVSTRVNNVAHDDPGCAQEVPLADATTPTLF